jgi:hypothetical protein
MTGGRDYRD